MTNDEQQQQNALIAEALEAQGLGICAWAPAKECPQGHPNRDDRGIAPDRGIGQLCMKCLIWNDYIGRKFPSEEQHRDKTWHPEWRFDRVPRDFARDSSLLLHAVDAYCASRDMGWDVGRYALRTYEDDEGFPQLAEPTHFASLGYHGKEEWVAEGMNTFHALREAFMAAIKAERVEIHDGH